MSGDYLNAVLMLLSFSAVACGPPGHVRDMRSPEEDRRAALEAAKRAKYRELRAVLLARNLGTLSDDDFHTVARKLRAQAIAIIRQIDELD